MGLSRDYIVQCEIVYSVGSVRMRLTSEGLSFFNCGVVMTMEGFSSMGLSRVGFASVGFVCEIFKHGISNCWIAELTIVGFANGKIGK